MPKEGELFLGIDGGGTKTVCAVSDAGGRILGLRATASTNYHNVGQRRTLLSIRKAVEAASEAAGVSSNHLDSACVGLPALDSPADLALMTRSVKSMKLSRLSLVTNYWRIALEGAFGGDRASWSLLAQAPLQPVLTRRGRSRGSGDGVA